LFVFKKEDETEAPSVTEILQKRKVILKLKYSKQRVAS